MKIYTGNLSYEVIEKDLRQEFRAFREVATVDIVSGKYDEWLKRFGSVEMATNCEAEAAIMGVNGKTLKERTVMVNEARPRTNNRSGGSYGDQRESGYGGVRGDGFREGRREGIELPLPHFLINSYI